jgi:molybdenum cofactor synthesis domain-containing protein
MNPDLAKSIVPTAAVLLIGNELLSGRTKDINLAYIAEGLHNKGIKLLEARVIPDDRQVIVSCINALRGEYTYVFTTGGIGPTHDDITAECIADAFGVDLPINAQAKSILLDYFNERGIESNQDRMRMARIPVGASLIQNTVSAAPGFCLANVFVFAGVPRIMQAMFDSILPGLQSGLQIGTLSIVCNLGEGTVASDLRSIESNFPNLEIGSYPGNETGSGRLSLVLKSTDADQLQQARVSLEKAIADHGGKVLEISEQ